jgi:hypothetical protein
VHGVIEHDDPLLGTRVSLPVEVADLGELGACIRSDHPFPLSADVALELSCDLPLRVHLGYDLDALVVDGPMHTHLVRVHGRIARCEPAPSARGGWLIGVALCGTRSFCDDLDTLRSFVDVLRTNE